MHLSKSEVPELIYGKYRESCQATHALLFDGQGSAEDPIAASPSPALYTSYQSDFVKAGGDDDEGGIRVSYDGHKIYVDAQPPDDARDKDREEAVYAALCECLREVSTESESKIPPEDLKTSKLYYIRQELTSTERSYTAALEMMVGQYLKPLKAEEVVSAEDLETIFGHLEYLLKIHAKLLAKLESDCDTCDAFDSIINDLTVYAKYCSNLPLAQAKLQQLENLKKSRVATLLKQLGESAKSTMSVGGHQRFSLKDLLAVPLQRVLRYPLLFRDLCKAIADEEIEDKQQLSALRLLHQTQDLAKFINEVKRDQENLDLIDGLERSLRNYKIGDEPGDYPPLKSYGKFLIEGELKVRDGLESKSHTRYVFLFQRAIIFTKIKGSHYHFLFLTPTEKFRVERAFIKGLPAIRIVHRKQRNSGSVDRYLISSDPHSHACWMKQILRAQRDVFLPTNLNNSINPDSKGELVGDPAATLGPTGKHSTWNEHRYELANFDGPSRCSHCGYLLWGLITQGYCCSGCNAHVHSQCLEKYGETCPGASRLNHSQSLPPLPRPPGARSHTAQNTRLSIYICLYDYGDHARRRESDLRFKKGDKIVLLQKTSAHWWEGRHTNGEEGQFPSSYVRLESSGVTTSVKQKNVYRNDSGLWFSGKISRDEASQILYGKLNGSFLIRESTNVSRPGELSLSVMHEEVW